MRSLNRKASLPNILIWFLFSIFIITLTGCDKFEGDQTVPSYLKIDSILFISDNELEGTSNQKISDAWVFIDDDLIGGFELPALIPILKKGNHKLEVRPGIILNGISDTRAPYPCIQPVIIESLELFPDSIVTLSLTSNYYENSEFVWMEDFEDASLAIKASQNSDTAIYRTNGNLAYHDVYSEFSGICYVDTANSFVQLVSVESNNQGFVFDRGDFIFLEINYRNNIPIVVGVYIKLMDNTVQQRSFLIINPTEEWNKIYVNFTPIVNETTDAVYYNLYLEAQQQDDVENGYIMLDNIKLVTRPNL
ncbi:MAG TPA: hypothetical protein PLW31_05095 [Bacteroidales bacterium]|nr:hypothetical protein [Bacteroidales bacterium]HPI86095.1 hypothetical protein [Bacteroidales bacterium]